MVAAAVVVHDGHMSASTTWTAEPIPAAQVPEPGPDAYVERLAAAGVLAEADRIFDQLDAGVNPCAGEPIKIVVERAREIIESKRR